MPYYCAVEYTHTVNYLVVVALAIVWISNSTLTKIGSLMQIQELKINQLSSSAYEWYLGYLYAIDEMNLEAYSKFLANNCTFLFGNNPIVYGKDAIFQSLGSFWSSINGIEHILKNIYGKDNSFVLEALNKYTRKDGKEVVVPAVAISDRISDGLVISIRIYTDTAPIFA